MGEEEEKKRQQDNRFISYLQHLSTGDLVDNMATFLAKAEQAVCIAGTIGEVLLADDRASNWQVPDDLEPDKVQPYIKDHIQWCNRRLASLNQMRAALLSVSLWIRESEVYSQQLLATEQGKDSA